MYPISQSRDSQASQVGQASRQITGLGEEKKAASSGKGLSVQQVGQNVRTFSSLEEVEHHKEHLNLNTLRAVVIGDVPFILKEVDGQIKFVPDDESIQAKLQQGQEKQGVNIYEVARTLNDIMKKEMIFRENIKILCQKIESIAENPVEKSGLFRVPGRDKEIKRAAGNFNQQALDCDKLRKNDFASIFKSLLTELTPVNQDVYLKMKQHEDQSSHLLNVDIAYNYRSKLVEQAHIRQLLSTLSFCYKHTVEDDKVKFTKDSFAKSISQSLFAKITPESHDENKEDLAKLFKAIFANWPVTTTSVTGVPSSSSSIPLPGPSHPMGAAGKQVTPVKSERAIRQQDSGRLSVAELRKFFLTNRILTSKH